MLKRTISIFASGFSLGACRMRNLCLRASAMNNFPGVDFLLAAGPLMRPLQGDKCRVRATSTRFVTGSMLSCQSCQAHSSLSYMWTALYRFDGCFLWRRRTGDLAFALSLASAPRHKKSRFSCTNRNVRLCVIFGSLLRCRW